MQIKMAMLWIAILLIAAGEKSPTARFEAVANRLMAAYNANDAKAFSVDFNADVRKALPESDTATFLSQVRAQYGDMKSLAAPHYTPPSIAVFPATFERGKLDIKIILDASNQIAGLWFLPPTSTDVPVVPEHKTVLLLPFKGEWFVFWGGDTKELNQHHDVPNQQFAFDLLKVGPTPSSAIGSVERGRPTYSSHKGDGKKNEDYYAYGQEILAPADGTVTEVIDGVRDNAPGSMNPYSALGNAVIIQYAEHEVSIMAHLKPGSIRVKPGDKVKRGQVVGLCGNSGNSSEPHLHFHLQNTPVVQDGTGIKIFFDKVLVSDGKGKPALKTHYSPAKGDRISPP